MSLAVCIISCGSLVIPFNQTHNQDNGSSLNKISAEAFLNNPLGCVDAGEELAEENSTNPHILESCEDIV